MNWNELGPIIFFVFLVLLLRFPLQWYLGIANLERELAATREQLATLQKLVEHIINNPE